MAYCSQCGSELEGRFCAKCGAPAPDAGATPGGPPPPSPSSPPPPPPPYPAQVISAPGLEENVASALCYLGLVLTGVLFLFIAPYNTNKNVRFHAFQSIFVWIGIVLVSWAVDIVLFDILYTGFTGGLVRLVWGVFRLGIVVLWLMLMYRAYNRERWVLPIIGEMAQKFA